jgi:hypothetical protein
MIFADPIVMLRWTVAVAAFAAFVTATELIAVSIWYRNGVFWRCCQGAMTEKEEVGPLTGWVNAWLKRWLPAVFVVKALAAAITLLLIFSGASYREALFVLTGCSLVVAYCRVVGGDGANQMTLIVLTASTLALVMGGETQGGRAALLFVGSQGLLAYFVAGVAKVISSEWRNEDVVSKITSTVSYGNGAAFRMMDATPGLGRVLTLSVIGFELAMPLAIIFPVHVTMGFLGLAFFFHVGCAVVMGLNDFVWAFASTFPAILFISSVLHKLIQ